MTGDDYHWHKDESADWGSARVAVETGTVISALIKACEKASAEIKAGIDRYRQKVGGL